MKMKLKKKIEGEDALQFPEDEVAEKVVPATAEQIEAAKRKREAQQAGDIFYLKETPRKGEEISEVEKIQILDIKKEVGFGDLPPIKISKSNEKKKKV